MPGTKHVLSETDAYPIITIISTITIIITIFVTIVILIKVKNKNTNGLTETMQVLCFYALIYFANRVGLART